MFNQVGRADARRIWISRDEGGGLWTEQVLVAIDDGCLGRLRSALDRKNYKHCAESESHDQQCAANWQNWVTRAAPRNLPRGAVSGFLDIPSAREPTLKEYSIG